MHVFMPIVLRPLVYTWDDHDESAHLSACVPFSRNSITCTLPLRPCVPVLAMLQPTHCTVGQTMMYSYTTVHIYCFSAILCTLDHC
jgi:hypothetical protein